ncbi:hypothetical protein HDU98_004859 [Podochytrium sp. JEL0797]|nr:hypothetical protein HDU98_004859 [Podochytrium sp. JEL0797]
MSRVKPHFLHTPAPADHHADFLTPDDSPLSLKLESGCSFEPLRGVSPSSDTPCLSPTCPSVSDDFSQSEFRRSASLDSHYSPRDFFHPRMPTPQKPSTFSSPAACRAVSKTNFITLDDSDTESVQLTPSEMDSDSDLDGDDNDGHLASESAPAASASPSFHSIFDSTTPTSTPAPANPTFLHSRELKALSKNFVTYSHPMLAIIYGPVAGKTRVVEEYLKDATTIQKRYRSNVFWISCLCLESIVSSLRGVLTQLQIGVSVTAGEDELKDKFCLWLSQHTTGRYLLVLDGARSMAVLDFLFKGVPALSGHVVITMKDYAGFEAFARKSTGHTVLIPMEFTPLEDDLEVMFWKKGSKREKNVDFSSVNHVVEETGGDALYSALVKSFLDLEKGTCLELVQSMLVVKSDLEGESAIGGTSRGGTPVLTESSSSASSSPEDEDPLLYLTHLSIESLLQRHGALGRAAVCVLEFICFVSPARPVTSSLLRQHLGLSSGNRIVQQAIDLLHSKLFLRLEHAAVIGSEQAYVISHADLHASILKLATRTPLFEIVSAVTLLFKSLSDSATTLHETLEAADQFIQSCIHIQQHLTGISSATPQYLEPLCNSLRQLATSLFRLKHYRESLHAFTALLSLLEIEPANESAIAPVMELTGLIASRLIHEPSPPLPTLFLLTRRDDTCTLSSHDLAIQTLQKSLSFFATRHTPTKTHYSSPELARQHMLLACTHASRAQYLVQQYTHDISPTTTQRAEMTEEAHLAKVYALCAVNTFAHLHGTNTHIEVVGALGLLVVGCVLNQDQLGAWNAVKRIFAALRELYGVDAEICFDDVVGSEEEAAGANEILAELVDVRLEQLLAKMEGRNVEKRVIQISTSAAKRLYRSLLLGSHELRDLTCGKQFGALLKLFKVDDATLRRYCRIEGLRSAQSLQRREDLIAAIQQHFSEQPVSEKDSVSAFVYALRHQGVLWKANLATRRHENGDEEEAMKE